jgi:predicted Holliday junction resolvase-like endonuclease
MDIVMLIGLVVLLICVFALHLENRKINRTLKYVEEQLSKKASEYSVDADRRQRWRIEEEIEAIKNYFGVKSVQQDPKVIIVKKDE